MNVEDARKIYIEAKEEQESLAEAKYKGLIKETDELIKKTASDGFSKCGIVCIPRFRERFISYYKKKGFKVSNISNSVTISWEVEHKEEWFKFTHYSNQRVSYDIYSKKTFNEIAHLYRDFHSAFSREEEEKMIDVLILLKEIYNGLNNSFYFKITGQGETKKVVDFLRAIGYEATHYMITSARSPRCEEFLITVSKGWLN